MTSQKKKLTGVARSSSLRTVLQGKLKKGVNINVDICFDGEI